MQKKAIATVVTRNRPRMLDNVLALLSNQSLPPQEILVVDNDSQPETGNLVSDWQKRNPAINYLNTRRNAGGAGGQKEAMRYALEHGYDVVYTMDDDCEPQENALKNIMTAWGLLEDRENWALNSLVLDVACPEKMSFGLWDGMEMGVTKANVFYSRLSEVPSQRIQNGLFVGWGGFFNGTLIPTALMRSVGLPNEQLFIRGDEREYLFRISSRGKVATVLDSVVLHPSESAAEKDMALWKRYYSTRNSIVIERQYFPSIKTSKLYLLARMVRYWTLARFGNLPSVNRTRALAVMDGLRDKFDRDAFSLK
jgi:rhamnopyranosyl-N-acetylglucosaminyl-diphospho-decaprenol beta-1,3/1,4-galactofuranosyltransferase